MNASIDALRRLAMDESSLDLLLEPTLSKALTKKYFTFEARCFALLLRQYD
jgi:hypothetical protein